ncbi:MAG: hypothetical protein A2014_05690 [Spirochaetes bacterium GWF1_49_6]|nr:MAG: hypothetical protein A2014_05690 [Spirochaetes bacterium GWF1_49_6]
MRTAEQRIDRLEELMERLAEEHIKTEESIRDLKEEMSDFKEEMSDFKNEMSDFKNEMSDFKNEMSDFKNEMQEFKGEIRDFKTESNKRWGELANRLGTIIEDIILPGAPDALKEKFGVEIYESYPRMKRRIPGTKNLEEFDLVLIGSDNKVYSVEVKSKPNNSAIDSAIEKAERLKNAFFPDRDVVTMFGTLYCDNDSVINYASNKNVLILAMKGEYLKVIN